MSGVTWFTAVGAVIYIFVHVAQRETGEIGSQLRLLRTGEAHERGAAAGSLGEASPHEIDRVAPALIQALEDDDGYVRYCAAAALGRLKLPAPLAQKAIGRLLLTLKDPDFRVRLEGAKSLRVLDADPVAAIPALIEASGIGKSTTSDREQISSQRAMDSTPTFSDWQLDAEMAAFQTLASSAIRGNRQAVSIMIGQVRSEVAPRRLCAIEALGPLAGSDRTASEALLSLTQDETIATDSATIDAIGVAVEANGPLSRTAFEELLRLARRPDLETQKQVITTMRRATRYFSEAAPVLDRGLQHVALAEKSARSLDTMAWTKAALAGFNSLEESRSPSLARRYIAARRLDPNQEPELAALLRLAHDQSSRISMIAKGRLSEGRGPEGIKAVLNAIARSNEDTEIRKLLMMALARGEQEHYRSALKGLASLARDRDPSIRADAIQLMTWSHRGWSVEDFKEIQQPLIQAFRDEDPKVRSVAQAVLEILIRQSTTKKLFDPTRFAQDAEPGGRYLAVLMSNPRTPAGVAELTEASRDTDARIRKIAVTALQKVDVKSEQSEAALHALASACQDKDPEVRQAAFQGKAAFEAASKKTSERQ